MLGLAEEGLFLHRIVSDEHGIFSSFKSARYNPHCFCPFDSHVHTTASDGARTPREIAWEAYSRSISVVVSDHNTVYGAVDASRWLERMKESEGGSKLSEITAGIEFSVWVDGMGPLSSLHLLGAGVDPKNQSLLNLAQRQEERRDDELSQAERRVFRMQSDGFIFQKNICRKLESHQNMHRALAESLDVAQSAKALRTIGVKVKRHHITNMNHRKRTFLEWQMTKALKRTYGNFKSRKLRISEAVSAIKDAQGAVIAPHIITSAPQLQNTTLAYLTTIFRRLRNLGIDAIEAYHPAHTLETAARISKAAHAANLAATGGSDAHTKNQQIGIFNHTKTQH